MKKNKVLVLGLGQNNFLYYLYSAIKKNYSNYIITVPEYRELSDNVIFDSSLYDNEGLKKNISLFSYIKAFFSLFSYSHIYHTLTFILFIELKFPKAIHFFYCSLKEKAFFIQNSNFKDYDVFHFHYIQYSYLRSIFFIPKGKKIICSFWGSDLLRTGDSFNHFFVKKALNRASRITCQTIELREIILSKYGREYSNKMDYIPFPLENLTFNEIDNLRNQQKSIDLFKENNYSTADKINVIIGHNANPSNNQIDIIKAICQDKKLCEQLHLVISLGYEASRIKKEELKIELSKILSSSNMSYTFIEKFMTGQELALYRLSPDFMIHMPISDALSGTMTEALYAGTLVITGSWLPYNILRKNGIYFFEIEQFDQLPSILNHIISNINTEKEKCLKNKEIIQNVLLNDNLIKQWSDILSSHLSS